MYENVYLGAKCSDPSFFKSYLGTKQGAVESPTLFNIFINDIPNIFDNSSCDPVNLCGKELNCLMYADDLVLISKSKSGLQKCLDCLGEYTNKWHLVVNIAKSKTMVVNSTGRLSKEQFIFLDNVLENVREYNYLGIVFSCSGSFEIAKQTLKDKGRKAMWKLRNILRGKNFGCEIPLKLFEQTVLPVLLYGAEIWSVLSDQRLKKDIDCDIESLCDIPQENIHMSFCKFVLGVGKNATHNGIIGELGRFPLYIEATVRLLKYFVRVKSAPNNSLLNVSYRESVRLHNTGGITWFSNVIRVLKRTNTLNLLLELNDRNVDKHCEHIREKLKERFNKKWKADMTTQRRDESNPKLRTYAKFKNNIEPEKYLKVIKDPDLRRALVKFRISAHNLHIEIGRYRPRQHRLKPEERKCQICNNDKIDDEFHCVMECLGSVEDRESLFENISLDMSTGDKWDLFIKTMKSEDDGTLLNLAKLVYKAQEIRNPKDKDTTPRP